MRRYASIVYAVVMCPSFRIFVVGGVRDLNLVDRLIVTSASVWMTNHPWKGRGQVTWTI